MRLSGGVAVDSTITWTGKEAAACNSWGHMRMMALCLSLDLCCAPGLGAWPGCLACPALPCPASPIIHEPAAAAAASCRLACRRHTCDHVLHLHLIRRLDRLATGCCRKNNAARARRSNGCCRMHT